MEGSATRTVSAKDRGGFFKVKKAAFGSATEEWIESSDAGRRGSLTRKARDTHGATGLDPHSFAELCGHLWYALFVKNSEDRMPDLITFFKPD